LDSLDGHLGSTENSIDEVLLRLYGLYVVVVVMVISLVEMEKLRWIKVVTNKQWEMFCTLRETRQDNIYFNIDIDIDIDIDVDDVKITIPHRHRYIHKSAFPSLLTAMSTIQIPKSIVLVHYHLIQFVVVLKSVIVVLNDDRS